MENTQEENTVVFPYDLRRSPVQLIDFTVRQVAFTKGRTTSRGLRGPTANTPASAPKAALHVVSRLKKQQQ